MVVRLVVDIEHYISDVFFVIFIRSSMPAIIREFHSSDSVVMEKMQ